MLISFSIYLVISAITALLSWGLGTFGALLGLFFTLFGMFLLQSALVLAVQDVRDGRVDLDLGATISAALPFIGSVAVASILASIAIGIGFVLLAAVFLSAAGLAARRIGTTVGSVSPALTAGRKTENCVPLFSSL